MFLRASLLVKNYLHNGAFLSNFVILSLFYPDFIKSAEDALQLQAYDQFSVFLWLFAP